MHSSSSAAAAARQTCTGDKDQATFNLKLALKLSGEREHHHPAPGTGSGQWRAGGHACLCSSRAGLRQRRGSHGWRLGAADGRVPPAALHPPDALASRPALPAPLTPAASAAGQGSVLSQEVDQLKRMLKAGAAWDVISQMMSYISDKAAQVGAWFE